MARKSSIDKLDPQIRDALDQLIRERRHTIDEIVEHIRALGGDVKRTAVGDYKQRTEAKLAKYREAQEVAGAWVTSLGEQRDSKTGQLLAELLKSIAFRTLVDMQSQDAGAEPEELMLLAKALKDVAGAQKTDQQFREQLRAAWKAELAERATAAADEATKIATNAGLTLAAAQQIRDVMMGVVG